jgi:putative flavoprotein involved in K+ transport
MLSSDLHETLGKVDGFEKQGQSMIDNYIAAAGIDAPTEELPQLRDGYMQPIIESLDLRSEGIGSIIWATGYAHDYGLVQFPIFDDRGFPRQNRGVTEIPGLYFVGLPWMPGIKTGTLAGVGESARHVVSELAAVHA